MQEGIYEIQESTEALFKDRGSKFYAYAYPVYTLDEIAEKLRVLKKKYYDARHHCYAYRLGSKGEHSFSTDDREPSNSAGPPILGAIRSAALTNTLVVVVRYFGGTKLGIRGLIEAYRTSAEEAIAKAPKLEIIAKTTFQIRFSYEKTSDINRILHPFDIEIVKAEYTDSCLQTIAIKEEGFPSLEAKLIEAGFEVDVIEESL